MPNNTLARREFLRLSGMGLALASLPALPACVHDPATLPALTLAPNPANANNQILSHSVHLPIANGARALRELLKEDRLFARATPGVHFARAAQVGDHTLTLGIIYDRRLETALNFLTENWETLDRALQHCSGYERGTASDPVRLRDYLAKHLVPDKLFFFAHSMAASEVQACLAVYEHFLSLLEAADGARDEELPYLVDRFLLGGLPRAATIDARRPVTLPEHVPFQPQLTNTLTFLRPLKSGRFDPSRVVPCSSSRLERVERFLGKPFSYEQVFELILSEGELAVKDFHEHPLAQLHTLHFARVGLIHTRDGPTMLFSSVYDGDFTQYVLDFGTAVADEIDFIWGLTKAYPARGCRDVPGFVAWLRDGQVDVENFFSASGNVTLLRVQKAAKLRERLLAFTRALPPDGAKLRSSLRAFVRDNQALLG